MSGEIPVIERVIHRGYTIQLTKDDLSSISEEYVRTVMDPDEVEEALEALRQGHCYIVTVSEGERYCFESVGWCATPERIITETKAELDSQIKEWGIGNLGVGSGHFEIPEDER